MIEFTCKCGKKLSVDESALGKKVKCPVCGNIETISASAEKPTDEIPPPQLSSAIPPETPQTKTPSTSVWSGCLGLLVFGIIGGLGVYFLFSKGYPAIQESRNVSTPREALIGHWAVQMKGTDLMNHIYFSENKKIVVIGKGKFIFNYEVVKELTDRLQTIETEPITQIQATLSYVFSSDWRKVNVYAEGGRKSTLEYGDWKTEP